MSTNYAEHLPIPTVTQRPVKSHYNRIIRMLQWRVSACDSVLYLSISVHRHRIEPSMQEPGKGRRKLKEPYNCSTKEEQSHFNPNQPSSPTIVGESRDNLNFVPS